MRLTNDEYFHGMDLYLFLRWLGANSAVPKSKADKNELVQRYLLVRRRRMMRQVRKMLKKEADK